MDDLIVFLTARLDETEARALAAREDWDDESQQYEWNDLSEAVYAHVYAHARCLDPALVLREVEAKRKIVRRCMAGMDELDVYPNGLLTPRALLSRQTLMDLAAVYSDHPDYWPAAAGKDGKR